MRDHNGGVCKDSLMLELAMTKNRDRLQNLLGDLSKRYGLDDEVVQVVAQAVAATPSTVSARHCWRMPRQAGFRPARYESLLRH